MRNPLRKRYKRELTQDAGKYLVIFLFMVLLIALVSGYLVVAESIETTFYEGFTKYNIEDGHITFKDVPPTEVLDNIASEGDLTFYDLMFAEEDLEGTEKTLRIYKERTQVDLECLVDGAFPTEPGQIALDRLFAKNNDISIGDTIRLNNQDLTVCGTIALPDYSCLFENSSDMMFNSIDFGVATMSEEGFEAFNSSHCYSNYAWKYNSAYSTEAEEDALNEDLMDVVEDVIKDYDVSLVQVQVNDLYARATELSDKLEDQFDEASDAIESKTKAAAKTAATKAVEQLSAEKKMELYMAGASSEDYFKAAAEEQGTTTTALIAKELGTTAQALEDLDNAVDELDATMDEAEISSEPPVINPDDLDEDDNYENDMDFSLDGVRDIVAKVDATGLYDVTEINTTIDELDSLLDFEFDDSEFVDVDSYLPKYQNKAITYCMDDMGSDRPMYIVFDYIVTAILAFVFAVTISNTLLAESGAIGTLRALGYTRGELVRHYLFIPVAVSLAGAVVGNILGYTVCTDFYKDIFYGSFCLANYEPLFNADAFLLTTVAPLIIMTVINLYVLITKLRISPMQFLRHQLKTKVKRRAMLLNKKLPFMLRFRLRILFQNIPAYITLALGIFFGGLVVVFGLMFGPMLNDYADMIVESKLSEYQYVLMEQEETNTPGVEKYCVTTLDSMVEGYLVDEVSVYGIEEDSAYILTDIPEGQVLVSEGVLAKYKLNPGDTLTLKEPYSDGTYDFIIADSYRYDGQMVVFMNRDEYLDTFDEDDDYFTGYFTNEKIDDIDSDKVTTIITGDDLKKVADQLLASLGEFMSVFTYFGVVMFILLMYLMTKQVLERNLQSIAMTKILGYRDREIAGLYLVMTFVVVVASLLISVPLIDTVLRCVFEEFLYTEITGYIPYIVDRICFVKEFVIGVACFIVVSIFMMIKINHIPKSEAIKNVE